MKRKVAVIGAGISGLACVHRLQSLDPGLEITVIERSARAGGTIGTEHADGFVIEAGPDAFLASKRGGLAMSRELGLEERMITPNQETKGSFVLSRGKLLPIPQGLSGLVPSELKPMFQTRLISTVGKARMAMDLVIPPRTDTGDESLASFVCRRMGPEMYHRMIEPLLSGIYAGDGANLSLAATFPQLRASEQTHGGMIKGALAQKQERASRDGMPGPGKGFLSFDQGMSVLVDRAVDVARERGARFLFGTECRQLRRTGPGNRYRLTLTSSGNVTTGDFDGVVVAVPAWAAAPILEDVVPDASVALGAIEHVSNALIAIGFPESQLAHPLRGHGYVVPRIENRDVMAMTWISSKWNHRVPPGQAMIRAFVGRAGQTRALEGDDASLIGIALDEMREVLDLDVTPTLARVYRIDRGMPQYNIGHLERIDRVESNIARTPGVEIAGNMLHGVGIPDCIVSGETAASNLLADFRNRTG
jgi:oxygen-dependent protoporphyrinogen oxidase